MIVTNPDDNRKSKFPYLVDIGLGDHCKFAGKTCTIPCYTSSAKNGKQALGGYVTGPLSTALAKANVLEVVFGGGEPTHHADIAYILHTYKHAKFKVGMTTRNYAWHNHRQFAGMVLNLNSLAVSCNTVKDLEDSAELLKKLGEVASQHFASTLRSRCVGYVQNILGLHPWKDMLAFVDKFKELHPWGRLTLLGYKSYGRGVNTPPHAVPADWVEQLKAKNLTLGVDSIIAKTYRKQLIDSGVDATYLVGAEGKQTCYIDAEKKIIKPSSFTDESYPLPDPLNAETFLEAYAKF